MTPKYMLDNSKTHAIQSLVTCMTEICTYQMVLCSVSPVRFSLTCQVQSTDQNNAGLTHDTCQLTFASPHRLNIEPPVKALLESSGMFFLDLLAIFFILNFFWGVNSCHIYNLLGLAHLALLKGFYKRLAVVNLHTDLGKN